MTKKMLILCSFSVFTLTPYTAVKAEIDARVTALGTVALYGAGAGALIGLATMAFGKKPRAIAQGASLGLYAGILFGSYIVVTHHMKKTQNATPLFPSSPYEEESEESRYDEYPGASVPNNILHFDRVASLQKSENSFIREGQARDIRMPLLEVNITF